MSLATVSIVSHGHGRLLHALLTDLERQKGIAAMRIVLTLNLHEEAFDAAAYPTLELKVLRNPQPKGFGANHNAAFAHCNSPWFVVLNPDLRMRDESTLVRLVGEPPREKDGLVAPFVVNSAGRPEDAVRSNLSLPSLLGRRRLRRLVPSGSARQGEPFYWLAGMCLIANSAAYRQVGGFDERFFLYCEDYDLCARLYLAGYELRVDDTATVIHDAQRDSHGSAKHLRWHVSSLLKVWLSSAFWRIVFTAPRSQA